MLPMDIQGSNNIGKAGNFGIIKVSSTVGKFYFEVLVLAAGYVVVLDVFCEYLFFSLGQLFNRIRLVAIFPKFLDSIAILYLI